MKPINIAILGSTGSIGTQALDIVRKNPGRFHVSVLTARSNWKLLARQALAFHPRYVLISDPASAAPLRDALAGKPVEILTGDDRFSELITLPEIDVVLNSLVGFSGFMPTYLALKSGKRVALANKESLVVGGEIIRKVLGGDTDQLVPVDSEHSAILQSLTGEQNRSIRKLILTASGGPFRTFSSRDMQQVTVEQALNHPNWSMGAKITIDSATMMNKGLEVIEAYWLFQVPLDDIETVIHPQSVIHSMVEFVDGSTKAQLGVPDMRVPIQYALTYPERIEADTPTIDWKQMQHLSFEPVDRERFPCLGLARESLHRGGSAPAVLNAANEIAVDRFLKREIAYIQIPKVVETCLNKLGSDDGLSADLLCEIDAETRKMARVTNGV